MNRIKVDCPGFGSIYFLGEKMHAGGDYLVHARGARDRPYVLAFFDSRGIGSGFAGSLAKQLMAEIEEKCGYMMICRPLELTTWATLYNFVMLNELAPMMIVTNMGFVDFTPKKKTILEDAIYQVDALMGVGIASSRFEETYTLSTGETTPIYSMMYSDAYRTKIELIVRRQATFVINTPPLSPKIRIPRARPCSFFRGLVASNQFNKRIEGTMGVYEFEEFDEGLTYDGVHYTALGNQRIFEKVRSCL